MFVVNERKPVVVITGASSGLGLSLAKTLIGHPYHLVLTARAQSLPRFQTADISEGPDLWIRVMDITNDVVSLVEPGFIRSLSFQNVRYTTLSGTSMRDPSETHFGHYSYMTSFTERLMRKTPP